MEAHIKQRIVGAVVIVAVVGLFLPILIHNTAPSSAKLVSDGNNKLPGGAGRTVVLQLPQQQSAHVSKSPTKVSFTQIQSVAQSTDKSLSLANAKPVVAKMHQAKIAKPIVPDAETVKSYARSAMTKVAQGRDNNKKKTITISTKASDISAKAKNKVKKSVRQLKSKSRLNRKVKVNAKKITNKNSVLADNMMLSSKAMNTKAWVLQLASFTSVKNARKLVQKLRVAGYDAYNNNATLANGKFISRVFVGPEIEYKKIVSLQVKLRSQFKLNGLIRQFKVK